MAKMNWKAIGLGATIIGGAISVLSSIASDKNTEAAIDEKVNERCKGIEDSIWARLTSSNDEEDEEDDEL